MIGITAGQDNAIQTTRFHIGQMPRGRYLQDLQDSSEEEEEGEGNEYDVTDKFLVADDDAEDGGDGVAEGTEGSAKRKKKRRRRRESDEELDEEDYELIVGPLSHSGSPGHCLSGWLLGWVHIVPEQAMLCSQSPNPLVGSVP